MNCVDWGQKRLPRPLSLLSKPAVGFSLVSQRPTTLPQYVHLYNCILLYVCGLPYVQHCLFGTYGADPEATGLVLAASPFLLLPPMPRLYVLYSSLLGFGPLLPSSH